MRTAFSAAIFTLILGALASAAAQKSDLVFVVDGSGSMWGRVDGEMKIVVAKQVLGDLLENLPSSIEVGLVAYGHRRKGDCTDIETMAVLGTSPSAIARQVDQITPHGKTPITIALQQGADLFKGRDAESTLVLISDGIETCAGDPCALANKLRSEDVDLVIHTVGFGVTGAAVTQLQCTARAGGGNYYHAENSEALREALLSVQQAVAEQKPAPPPPSPPQVTTTTKTQTVVVTGLGTIVLKLASWVKLPYQWLILDAETGSEIARANRESLRAKVGEYQISWRQSEHGHSVVPLTEIVSVASRETTEVHIDTGLRVVPPEGTAAPYTWSLHETGESKPLAWFARTLDPAVVPAGRYHLVWRQEEHASRPVVLGEVDILPGRLNEYVIDFGVVVEIAEWVPGNPYMYQLLDLQGKVGGQFYGILGPQLISPGQYKLVYRQTEHGHSPITWGTISVPEHGFATVAIDSGVKFTHQSGMSPPYRAIFIDLDSGAELVWRGTWVKNWQAIPIPPGRYRLDWWEIEHGTKRMTLIDEFTVPEHTLVEVQL